MALNDLKYVLTQGVGAVSETQDGIAGMIFYSNTLPSGFSTSDRIKFITSVKQAEDLGINSSSFAASNYQISEYFRIADQTNSGKLYISYNAIPAGSNTFSEVKAMKNFSNGEVKTVSVYSEKAFSTTDILTLHTVCVECANEFAPVVALYNADMSTAGSSGLAAYVDLSNLNAYRVAAVAAQDGGATGAALATTLGKSVSAAGAILGLISSAKVSDSIGWLSKYPMCTGAELDVIALTNGTLVKTLEVADMEILKDRHWLFCRRPIRTTNTFVEATPTCISDTNDFCTIERVRTIDKAMSVVRETTLPEVKRPAKKSREGKLSLDYITYMKSVMSKGLEKMVTDEELSEFEVIIDPNQNLSLTRDLKVTLELLPIDVTEKITVSVGFVSTL